MSCAQFVEIIFMKSIFSYLLIYLLLIGCKSDNKSVDANAFENSNKTPSSKLTKFLNGTWQLKADSEQTMTVTKDSIFDFYNSKVSTRSFMVIDSLSVADKYLIADTAYDFTKANESSGLKIRLYENFGKDSSEVLLIYIDIENLELGTHNGSHLFKRIK